jgi:ribonucleotide reductase beta subunit family protein with ferritin-like domain
MNPNTITMLALDAKLKNNVTTSNYNDTDEYLLDPKNNRLTMYPIQDTKLWQAYKTQQAAIWSAEDIDFSVDKHHYAKLSPGEQHFIKMILAFFSSSDTIVNINLGERFLQDVKIREAITAYTYQMYIESIHSEVYSLQLENIITDVEERDKLMNAVREFPAISLKADWAVRWIESDKSFAHRLIAFAIFEGIYFSGSFCAIFWFKKRGLMPGLCASNEFISRDEGMHLDFAVLCYSYIKNRVPEKEVHQMFKEAVAIEIEFICESLPCALLGMNATLMEQYVKFVSDRLLVSLGYSKIWFDINPFQFMESISIEGKTNFFEHRPTQYQNSHILNKSRDIEFNLNEDF